MSLEDKESFFHPCDNCCLGGDDAALDFKTINKKVEVLNIFLYRFLHSSMMRRQLTKNNIQRMREAVLKGKSKFQVSREMHLHPTTVYEYTKDLPNKYKREPYISGKPLELLKQLLEKGYVYTEENRNALRALQRYFPQIKRSQFKNKSCYYLEDKIKLALLEMMKQNTSRIISYQDLARASEVFNTDIEIYEKRMSLGKPHKGEVLCKIVVGKSSLSNLIW